jgi:preprotein translocase subunit SecG
MAILAVIFIVLFVIISFIMSFFVLVQDEQGDSIGGLFGGGSSASPFGASSNSMMVRITAILGASFMILSLAVALVVKTPATDNVENAAIKKQAQDNTTDWFAPKEDVDTQGSDLLIPEE